VHFSAIDEQYSGDSGRNTGDAMSAKDSALHRAKELRLWGGSGGSAACDHCRRAIESTQTDYEVDAELDGSRLTLHFHRDCYDQWKAQLRAAGSHRLQLSPSAY
jgi:hypothetical protein